MSQIPILFQNYHDPLNPLWRFLFIPGVQTGPGFCIFWIFFASAAPSFSMVAQPLLLTWTWPLLLLTPWKSPTPGFWNSSFTRTWGSWRCHPGSGYHILVALLLLFLLSLPDLSGGSPFPVLRYLHKAISSWLWVGWWCLRWDGISQLSSTSSLYLISQSQLFPWEKFWCQLVNEV